MDPNATLEQLRQLAGQYLNPDRTNTLDDDVGTEMAELVHGLDEWLSAGGCLPAAWEGKR